MTQAAQELSNRVAAAVVDHVTTRLDGDGSSWLPIARLARTVYSVNTAEIPRIPAPNDPDTLPYIDGDEHKDERNNWLHIVEGWLPTWSDFWQTSKLYAPLSRLGVQNENELFSHGVRPNQKANESSGWLPPSTFLLISDPGLVDILDWDGTGEPRLIEVRVDRNQLSPRVTVNTKGELWFGRKNGTLFTLYHGQIKPFQIVKLLP